MVIFTIGHSTRPFDEFASILQEFGITLLVDVRTIPRSRRNPQFNKDTFPHLLEPYGISYIHMKELGGLRKARTDSIHTEWRNESFRGYADYMDTTEFAAALDNLITLASDQTIAIMCAEAVPWRCHRSMIADALQKRDFKVIDILGSGNSQVHQPILGR
jgi:uncharacterized protein (DUF488 family)